MDGAKASDMALVLRYRREMGRRSWNVFEVDIEQEGFALRASAN